MMAKRCASASTSSRSKKARVTPEVDEVEANIALVLKAVEKDTTMSTCCRDMLVTLAPLALGSDAAQNQRHAFQNETVDMIREVLSESVASSESNWRNDAALVEAAANPETEKAEALAAAKARIEACLGDVKVKQRALEDAKEDVDVAKSELAGCENAVGTCEKQKSKKEQARTSLNSLIVDNFEVLKACAWETPEAKAKGEKKLMRPLLTQVKKLKADCSLLDVVPSVLEKKPEERGEFDNLAVQQVEDVLTSHRKELDDWLESFEPTLAEKMAAVEKQKIVLEDAALIHSVCEEFLKDSQASHSESKAKVKEAKEVLAEHKTATAELKCQEAEKLAMLDQAKNDLAAFTFLSERMHSEKVESEEAAVEAEEAAVETVTKEPVPVTEPAAADSEMAQ
jgi:hypothetical protein